MCSQFIYGNSLLWRRLVPFAINTSDVSDLLELDDVAEADVIEWLRENKLLESLVLEYKLHKKQAATRWRRDKTVFRPYTSLQKLKANENKRSEKYLVMSGFESQNHDGRSGWCAFCGIQLEVFEMEIEHLLPECSGGKKEWSNLVPACPDCNREKDNLPADKFVSKSKLFDGELQVLSQRWAAAKGYRDTHPLVEFHLGRLSTQKRRSFLNQSTTRALQ